MGRKVQLVLPARLRKSLDHRGRAVAGRIGVQQFGAGSTRAARLKSSGLPAVQRSASPRHAAARSVSRMSTLRRTRLGMLLTAPGKPRRCRRSRPCRWLRWCARHSQSPESIQPRRREHRGGRASERRPHVRPRLRCSTRKTGRRGNVRHNAERNMLALQQRSLLNVQFDERLVVAARQFHLLRVRRQSRPRRRTSSSVRAVFVGQSFARHRRESSRQQAASQTSNAKARRLFRGENQQLDGMPGTEIRCAAMRELLPDLRARRPRRRISRRSESRRCASRCRPPARSDRSRASARKCFRRHPPAR